VIGVKDDRLYVRLSREEKKRLVEISAPYGGISNWISARLRELVEKEKTGIGLRARKPGSPPGLPVSLGDSLRREE
jgi:hypothetical protein